MSWLLPAALAVSGVAMLGTAALHFISTRRPLAEPLPTARFIPARAVRARIAAFGLADVLLLLMRIAAIAAIGAGVAGPVFAAARGRIMRIVLVDQSRAVASSSEARDSVRALLAAGDVLVAFDSTARAIGYGQLDSARGGAVGSISAALASAIRTATSRSPHTGSLDLVLISPLAREEVDSATAPIRESWPGRIRLVHIRAVAYAPRTAGVAVTSSPDDALHAGLSLMGLVHDTGSVRVMRGRVSSPDSSWARQSGHVLVHWPASADSARWPARASIDAIGGVVGADGTTLIGRFPRVWHVSGRAVAWWADGEVAAAETATGAGCVRDVGILIDQSSDLTLRSGFRAFASTLLGPCGGAPDFASLDSSAIARLAGSGRLAPASAFTAGGDSESRWSPWLLAIGAALLIGELAARRRVRSTAA